MKHTSKEILDFLRKNKIRKVKPINENSSDVLAKTYPMFYNHFRLLVEDELINPIELFNRLEKSIESQRPEKKKSYRVFRIRKDNSIYCDTVREFETEDEVISNALTKQKEELNEYKDDLHKLFTRITCGEEVIPKDLNAEIISTSKNKRKTVSIMVTDMKGFSKKMIDDEDGTINSSLQHDELIQKIASENGGEKINSTGDGFIYQFESAQDTIQAAIKIQKSISKKFPIRIGIHTGDIKLTEDIHRSVIANSANSIQSDVQSEKSGFLDKLMIAFNKKIFVNNFKELEKGY